MAAKAYEDACNRAELFGQPIPNKEEFFEKNKHLDVVEFEDIEIKTVENIAMLDDHLKQGKSGLTELNTILNSTQTKINRLKGVCGSITNFFRVKLSSKDNLSYSSEPSYIGQTNYDKDYIPSATEIGSVNEGLGPNDKELELRGPITKTGGRQNGSDINSAIDDLKTMQEAENAPSVSKAVITDISKQVNSQMSQLDQLIFQADKAQASLSHQNKQLRSFLR